MPRNHNKSPTAKTNKKASTSQTGVHKDIIIIGDLLETYHRPIGDPLETEMPHGRSIGDRLASSGVLVSDEACQSMIRHVGLQLVSYQANWSPMGLRSDMSISNGSPIVTIFF